MYLIATIFARGWEFGRNQAWRITGGAGLITVLTLIAAVILAISGHYPQWTFGPRPSLSVTLAIVDEGPACLGSGEELDAEINGCPDKRDARGLIDGLAVVGAESHAAEPEPER
jgi:hypothetical protein